MNRLASPSNPAHGGAVRELANRNVVRVRRGNTDWRVESDYIDLFFDRNDLRLDHWLASGAATVVKTGSHRTVYRLDLPAGGFYLKHYKTPGWQSRMQNLFRPCKAMLEWTAAQRVAKSGVATIEPIAVGRVLRGPFVADSFLITPEIPGTIPLHDFVLKIAGQDNPQHHRELSRFRIELARRLGEMVGRLHRHGLIHRDLHAGNILLSTATMEKPSQFSLTLIDLHAVHTQRSLTLRHIERNLALLGNFFSHFSTAGDRRRFFQSYWSGFRGAPAESSSAANRVESHYQRAIIEAHNKADRKWSRGNRRLLIADSPTIACRGLAEIGMDALCRLRDSAESVFAAFDSTEHNAAVGTLTFGSFRKQVRLTSTNESSPVRNAWETGHALLRRGVDVERPILFIAPRRDSGKLPRQFLITEHEKNAVPLAEWLTQLRGLSNAKDAERRIRAGVRALADSLRKMHLAGFHHSALTADRILVAEGDAADLPPRMILRGMNRVRRDPKKEIAESIHTLSVGIPADTLRLTHRLRFLKRLLGKTETGQWKTIWSTAELTLSRTTSNHLPQTGRTHFR